MSACRSVDKQAICITVTATGERRSGWMHTIYNPNGSMFGFYLTETNGTLITDVAPITYASGTCPVSPPDVEWEPLCDLLADGSVVPFIRRSITTFDASGAVIDPVQVSDFALDKITPYVVAGTVGTCPTCPDEAPIGLVTDFAVLA